MSFTFIRNNKIQTGICLWQNSLIATTVQQTKNNIVILQVSQKFLTAKNSIEFLLSEMKNQLKKGECFIAINSPDFIIRHLGFEQQYRDKELLNYLELNTEKIFGQTAEKLRIDYTPMQLLKNTEKFHFNAVASPKNIIELWSTAFKKSKLNLTAIDINPFAFYRILAKRINKEDTVSLIILTSTQLQIYVFSSHTLLYDRCEPLVALQHQDILPLCSRIIHYYHSLDEMPVINQIYFFSEFPMELNFLHEKINISFHPFHINDLLIERSHQVQLQINLLPILGFYCSLGCALWRTKDEY